MSLITKIKSDLIEARKARTDKERISLLTTLSSEIAIVGKNDGNRETRDDEALAVIRKFVKNAEQTLTNLEAAGRSADAGAVQHELGILKAYLPTAPSAEEIEAAAREIVAGAESNAGKPGALRGLVMKELKARFGDRFDGAAAAPVVGRVLGA
jgi:Uncharacterized conserved protein